MPNFPIVDAHVHLFDIEHLSYGWLQSVPPINRTYLMPDFDRARGAVEVESLVFVEVAVDPGLHLDEARFVQDIADTKPRIGAIVAHAPVEKGAAVEADLETLLAMRSVKGIRRLIQGETDPGICLHPDFIAGVKRVGALGLTFDICVKSFALAYGLELARRCPNVTFILDHIGKPDIRHGLRDPWWGQITALAALPNVFCKVSGVITEADHARWTTADVAPYISHVIDAFGFDRCLYGSDWPVGELTHRYPTFVEILDGIVASASEADRRKLYRDTAKRVYRLA